MFAFIEKRIFIIRSDKPGYIQHLKKQLLILSLGCAVIFSLYFFLWKPNFELALNKTTSLPQKLFLVVKGEPVKRGNYVAFYPPDNPLYGNKIPFLKIVAGVPGDVVTRRGREFFINGNDTGRAYQKADDGLALHVGPTGVLKKEEYYVYTPNPKSYDSRYASIGWIRANHIVGRAYPLF